MRHLRGQRLIFRDGRSNWPYDLTAQERDLGVGGLTSRYILNLMESIGDPTAPDWDIGRLMEHDKLSLGDYVRSRGASDGAVQLLRDNAWFGQGIESGSALAMLVADFALGHKEAPFGVIEGGNDQLPKAMARAMQKSIRYGMPVRSIVERDTGVEVHCGLPGHGELTRIQADRCICTLPLPALRGVDLMSSLPTTGLQATPGVICPSGRSSSIQ